MLIGKDRDVPGNPDMLDEIIDTTQYDLEAAQFRQTCRQRLNSNGVLVLPGFITDVALAAIKLEAVQAQHKVYASTQNHSVYLSPVNENKPADHAFNRQVVSSKGCICDDDVPKGSALRQLHDSMSFRSFISAVTDQAELHPYADDLSSINIHYASHGQELGWHFDNSDFAITLLIEKPEAGSRFEFIKDFRNAEAGDMNFDGVNSLLDGRIQPDVLDMEAGSLVLFRGRNSIHRVSPNESDSTRLLAVLAYNAKPGISLSESARMTFYGRLS